MRCSEPGIGLQSKRPVRRVAELGSLGDDTRLPMSSTRQLRMGFPDEIRAIELLDWETRPEDFDRLCEFIIGMFGERDHVSRERLFSILREEEFRRELRCCAESFSERG